MRALNSTDNAAKACGMSERHFTRLVQELKIQPIVLNTSYGRNRKQFFTPAHIEQVKNRSK